MQFKSHGKNIKVYPQAKIINPQNLDVGSNVIIDDFTFLHVGEGSKIGSYVHIAAFVNITGGTHFEIGDFASISSHSAIFTSTDDFLGNGLTNPTVPPEFRKPIRSTVKIGKHCMLGAHVVVIANAEGITIGEGAVVGAGSLVKGNLDPWGIYVGVPARKIGERQRYKILEQEKELLSRCTDSQSAV